MLILRCYFNFQAVCAYMALGLSFQCTHIIILYIYFYMYVGVSNLKLMEIFNSCTNKTNIFVTWDAATSRYCGGVLYYIVMISSDEHSNIMNDIVNVTSPLTATFSNLRNNTTYDVTVTAYNRVGAGMTTTESLRILLPEPTQRRSNNTGSYIRTVYVHTLYNHRTTYVHSSCYMYVRMYIHVYTL